MKPGPAQDPSRMDAAARGFGLPPYNRRLSDKVLAAFNHAYAAGEREIAAQLRAVLTGVEARMRAFGAKPRHTDALAGADSWARFVDARDRYHTVKHDPRFDGAAVGEALAEMKEAFESWSLG